MESMVKPTQNTGKVIPFVTGQPSPEGQLEKWFRGIVQSNNDLISALEQLRDSYKNLFAGEADHADTNIHGSLGTVFRQIVTNLR